MATRLTDRELATVLAALRSWQQGLLANEPQVTLSPDHFDDMLTPLTAAEVDDLCERLNSNLLPGEMGSQLLSLTAPIQVWPKQANHPVPAIALLGERYPAGDFIEVTVHGLVPASGGFQALDHPVVLILTRTMITAAQDVDPQTAGDAGDPSAYPL